MSRLFAFLSLIAPVSALAQSKVDIMTAQGQMHSRVMAVVEKRAKELGVGHDVVTYCRIELNNHTGQIPKDGSIPFGVNYNEISDAGTLKTVIEARESYEKTFLLLCLSRASRELAGK